MRQFAYETTAPLPLNAQVSFVATTVGTYTFVWRLIANQFVKKDKITKNNLSTTKHDDEMCRRSLSATCMQLHMYNAVAVQTVGVNRLTYLLKHIWARPGIAKGSYSAWLLLVPLFEEGISTKVNACTLQY